MDNVIKNKTSVKSINKSKSSIINKKYIISKFVSSVAALVLQVGCVMTPDGDFGTVGVDAGVDVSLTPQILVADRSFVTVRLGPSFYASDAYLLAYEHCLGQGLYAYEISPWAHSASVIRDLRYGCRPTYIAPPIVYHVDRSNRYRYGFFDNYYRTRRPHYHYRPPSTGWWGQSNNGPHVDHGRGVSRDGRLTTPSSPWSYNSNKNRYVPRNERHFDSQPQVSSPRSSSGWWGRSRRNSNLDVTVPNNDRNQRPLDQGVSAPPSSPSKSKFWGRSKSDDSSGSSSSGGSIFSGGSSSSRGSVPEASSPSRGQSSSPGWWGKK